MKKIYSLLLAISITGCAFAQNLQLQHFQKHAVSTAVSTNKKINSVTNVSSQSKDVNALLNQNFDALSFPPASWAVSGVSPAWYNSGDAAINQYEANGTPSGHFAYFDCFNLTDLDVASLITPVLHPTVGSNTLAYNVNYYLLNNTYITYGASLFIEFSTDGGTTWTTSATNVLATLPNYNTASSGWQPKTVSLAAYNGGAVQVRFRGVSDYGGFGLGIDDVTGPNADIITAVNDVEVMKTFADFAGMSYYGITPLSQVGTVDLGAIVVNNGSAAQTNVTLYADDAINSISGIASLASQASGSVDTLLYTATLDNITAKDYAFSMNVAQTQTDEVPANNVGDSIYFSTDPSWYLRTYNLNQYLTPYSFGGGAPAITGMEYGANYHFLNADIIDSVVVLIYGANGGGTVTGKLYDGSTGTNILVGQTNPYTPSGIPEWAVLPLIAPFTISTLPAILDVTVQMNLTIGPDTIKIGAENGFPGNSAIAGSAYLNVAGTWGWYSITNTVPMVGVITHLIVDVPSVNNIKDLQIYPNPVSNTIYVVNQKAKEVEIYNMTGAVVAKFSNQNVINVSNIATGTYFIKVVTDKKVITEKINIVR